MEIIKNTERKIEENPQNWSDWHSLFQKFEKSELFISYGFYKVTQSEVQKLISKNKNTILNMIQRNCLVRLKCYEKP